MIELVYGGSGSGKSEFSESEVLYLTHNSSSKRFYIATMSVNDDESKRRVEKHKNLRAGKNFITIEAPVDLENACNIIEENLSKPLNNAESSCVLLECLSNLTANEMFTGGRITDSGKVFSKIRAGLEKLFTCAENIIIVSNNIFDDGLEYDETTRSYMNLLAKLNAFVSLKADKIFEVTAGIPVEVK